MKCAVSGGVQFAGSNSMKISNIDRGLRGPLFAIHSEIVFLSSKIRGLAAYSLKIHWWNVSDRKAITK